MKYTLSDEDKAEIRRSVQAMPPMPLDALERIAALWAANDERDRRERARRRVNAGGPPHVVDGRARDDAGDDT